MQVAKAEAAHLTEQATALRAEREAAQKAAAEAQRGVQTASADLQALQASHVHQKQQLQSQLDQLQLDSAALQVCIALPCTGRMLLFKHAKSPIFSLMLARRFELCLWLVCMPDVMAHSLHLLVASSIQAAAAMCDYHGCPAVCTGQQSASNL